VKDGKITSLEEVFLYSLPVKEAQIIDFFLPEGKVQEEVMKIMPVQKQSAAGQRTRFKCFLAIGDADGHIGLGVKCASEVSLAIQGAIILGTTTFVLKCSIYNSLISAKLSIVPVRRGYWGSKMGLPHTVPMKVTGKCGSVRVRLVPAPRGTGLVASPVPKKILTMAGIHDCYTSSRGHTRTMGNFLKATFAALGNTYTYLSPDMWAATDAGKTPYQEHTDFLGKFGEKKALPAAPVE
jgi:small subunit ribosomal protein S2e